MSLENLENLVKAGKLKKEPVDKSEFLGLVESGKARLKDASNKTLELESRFTLAYSAAHSIVLASLRWHGYRSDSRYIVFQSLQHTLGVGPEIWRVLDACHNKRNIAEYQGYIDVNSQLVSDLITTTQKVLGLVEKLEVK